VLCPGVFAPTATRLPLLPWLLGRADGRGPRRMGPRPHPPGAAVGSENLPSCADVLAQRLSRQRLYALATGLRSLPGDEGRYAASESSVAGAEAALRDKAPSMDESDQLEPRTRARIPTPPWWSGLSIPSARYFQAENHQQGEWQAEEVVFLFCEWRWPVPDWRLMRRSPAGSLISMEAPFPLRCSAFTTTVMALEAPAARRAGCGQINAQQGGEDPAQGILNQASLNARLRSAPGWPSRGQRNRLLLQLRSRSPVGLKGLKSPWRLSMTVCLKSCMGCGIASDPSPRRRRSG